MTCTEKTNQAVLRAVALKAHATHSQLQRDLYRAAVEHANHLLEV